MKSLHEVDRFFFLFGCLFTALFTWYIKKRLGQQAEQEWVSREEVRCLSTLAGPFADTLTHREAALFGGRLAVRSPRPSGVLRRAHFPFDSVFFSSVFPAVPLVVQLSG